MKANKDKSLMRWPVGIPAIGRRQVTEMGLVVVSGCLFMGLYRGPGSWFTVALAASILALVLPWAFYPLALVWFALGEALGMITSRVILTLLFVGLVVPIGWLRRIFGKDPLRLQAFKKGNESVFVDRDHTYQSSDLQYPF